MENIFRILDSLPLVGYILLAAVLGLLIMITEIVFVLKSLTGSGKDSRKQGSIFRNTRLVELLILNKELYTVR